MEAPTFVRRSNGRLDLIHAGRPIEAAMLARREAFLLKHPGHELREFRQARTLAALYYPVGWTR